MCRNHHDLLEMAVIESLPLGHPTSSRKRRRGSSLEANRGFEPIADLPIVACRRFCDGQSTKDQTSPISNCCETATHSPSSTCDLEFSRVQQALESGSGLGSRRFKSPLVSFLTFFPLEDQEGTFLSTWARHLRRSKALRRKTPIQCARQRIK